MIQVPKIFFTPQESRDIHVDTLTCTGMTEIFDDLDIYRGYDQYLEIKEMILPDPRIMNLLNHIEGLCMDRYHFIFGDIGPNNTAIFTLYYDVVPYFLRRISLDEEESHEYKKIMEIKVPFAHNFVCKAGGGRKNIEILYYPHAFMNNSVENTLLTDNICFDVTLDPYTGFSHMDAPEELFNRADHGEISFDLFNFTINGSPEIKTGAIMDLEFFTDFIRIDKSIFGDDSNRISQENIDHIFANYLPTLNCHISFTQLINFNDKVLVIFGDNTMFYQKYTHSFMNALLENMTPMAYNEIFRVKNRDPRTILEACWIFDDTRVYFDLTSDTNSFKVVYNECCNNDYCAANCVLEYTGTNRNLNLNNIEFDRLSARIPYFGDFPGKKEVNFTRRLADFADAINANFSFTIDELEVDGVEIGHIANVKFEFKDNPDSIPPYAFLDMMSEEYNNNY